MRHQVKRYELRRNTSHRRALLRNLVTSLLEKERVKTTLAKAKATRPVAEKMITLGRQNTLAARRRALGYITKESVVQKLFTELGPRFKERPGGYTRIVKLGMRSGDGAQMAMIELLGAEYKKKAKKKAKPTPPGAK
ncbi:MAG TPA: 50S ribosomal protein L17 [Candidatus Saccharicenans sp.]|jgi:large subunit ribosomal protein L17|nr:50S ribosomal protein L17 [Candidatus Saccharicenans sp.]HQI22786.1 50S ribosomal protein L17 [Candidatus Saccharicenans sp.]HUM34128.1 50S ribosomal protein L17 [Candidatus Saccharicenans sp.]